MHFELKHTFDAPLAEVLEAMLDPALDDYLKANVKLVKDIKPMERVEDGRVVRRKVRYVPVPMIQKVGPKHIPPEALAWVAEFTIDRDRHEVSFKNIGEHERVRRHLENGGTLRFRDVGGGKTERVTSGELKVTNLPFILRPLGMLAEQIIYSNAQKILNEEARAFGEFLKHRGTAAKPASA
jgi:hypothetical protein